MALGSLTSLLCLMNRILKAVSAFPTYWILQSSHSSKYMMKLLLQVVFWNILNVLLVWLLLKCSVFITCLQQSVLEFEKHGEHFPLVNLLVVSNVLFFFYCVPSNQLSQVLAFVESWQGPIFKYLVKFRVDIQCVSMFLKYCFDTG